MKIYLNVRGSNSIRKREKRKKKIDEKTQITEREMLNGFDNL